LMSFVMLPNFQWLLLWLMLVVFANDIAAYFIGTKVKGPKLAPEISPNKTISGSVGAIFVATTVGIVFSYLLYLPERYTYLDISLLSAFTVIVAQLGDLSKSYLKRLYGVKDTGSILPGHGGLLDRVDGLLMSAPILYFWLAAF
ncbi:MAG: phosphatidate cytidylyltransferase, partial [bacterium]|nr:phosphatidate cytidylyltransferase [bacterium]